MRKHSRFGWTEFIIGILLILVGMFTAANPGKILSGLVFLYGIVAVVMGAADLLLYIRLERFTGFGPVVSLISGILTLLSGIMLLIYPNAGTIVLSLLFPVWFIAHCISRLSHVNQIRLFAGKGSYYSTLIINILGLILGILMIFHPIFSLAAIGFIAGFYLILLGINSIVLAFSKIGLR